MSGLGAIARDNPFRFSTKFCDEETGLSYYGYRFYDPTKGRWMSRDPIGERGGKNLYVLLNNQSTIHVDYLGLEFSGTYSISQKLLKLVDNDRKNSYRRAGKETCECPGSSGSNDFKDVKIDNVGPLPTGSYEVFDLGTRIANRPTYLLDPVDAIRFNDYWDRNDGIKRYAFRIHVADPSRPNNGSDGWFFRKSSGFLSGLERR